MSPEYLGCSDILEIKKAGDTLDHSSYHEKNSYESLYDPVNAPGTPFLCANKLVPEAAA